jgi:2-keto-4-pentenoate hydratase/2-oxohepta-3-ene-1,7-dioic acid hydratase in catechol pathway
MLVRFQQLDNHQIEYGYFLEEKGVIHYLKGDIFGEYDISDQTIECEKCRLLAPVTPSKVVAVGLNYKDHAKEVNLPLPKYPMLFIKPDSSVIGPDCKIVCPAASKRVEYEAELAVVIKKEARDIDEGDWREYVLGFTCANDVTARDIQFSDDKMTHLTWSKSFDTFCPIGPGIVELENAGDLDISLYVNGEKKQESNTSELIFSIPYLVSHISRIMTLKPGDVIITGTPHGIGELLPGDEVVVEIERVGRLANRVK